ncbi:MAG TPA: LysR family transcriptional regulator [Burkholderiaceae bacterium]
MNPKALDIQLLQVFDALMAERNVTKAARQIGLSQSALSHALGRLRERLGDPLLIRTSKGMEPTARALELVGPVRDAIRQVEAVFRSEARFDPLQSKESFVIRIGDSNEFLLLPALLKALEARAPQVSVVVRHLSPADTLKGLEEGTIDCAVSALLAHPKAIRSTALMRDRMICAMSRDHPSARETLTMARFLALRHIRVVQDAGDSRFVDDALRARRVAREVVATIPHWVVALHAVSSSGMVVAASERMARRFDTDRRLVLRKLPIGGEPFSWQLYWHRRHEGDAGQRWMRALVEEVCSNLDRADAAR